MKLAFEQHGAGPDLVILHGLFGSARNWRSHVRVLSEQLRVTVVDLRNHGQSPHDAEMTYEAMADDLWRFLHEQGLENATVLGHSMGGKAVMTMALQRPDWCGEMIVADIAPVAYPPRFQDVLAGLQALPLQEIRSRREADEQLGAFLPQAGLRTFLLTNLVRADEGFGWRVNLPVIIQSMPEIEGFSAAGAAPSQVASLFLRGSRSEYVDEEGVAAISKLFPDSSIQTIEDAGHWIHADQPAKLIEAVLGYCLG